MCQLIPYIMTCRKLTSACRNVVYFEVTIKFPAHQIQYKMIPELTDMSYEGRIEFLKLPRLAYRKLRGDVIEMYKYTHNIYQVAATPYNLHKDTPRRNNSFKIIRHAHLHRRQFLATV